MPAHVDVKVIDKEGKETKPEEVLVRKDLTEETKTDILECANCGLKTFKMKRTEYGKWGDCDNCKYAYKGTYVRFAKKAAEYARDLNNDDIKIEQIIAAIDYRYEIKVTKNTIYSWLKSIETMEPDEVLEGEIDDQIRQIIDYAKSHNMTFRQAYKVKKGEYPNGGMIFKCKKLGYHNIGEKEDEERSHVKKEESKPVKEDVRGVTIAKYMMLHKVSFNKACVTLYRQNASKLYKEQATKAGYDIDKYKYDRSQKEEEKEPEVETYSCNLCVRTFQSKAWYTKHKKTCKGDKPKVNMRLLQADSNPDYKKKLIEQNDYVKKSWGADKVVEEKTYPCSMCGEHETTEKNGMCAYCLRDFEDQNRINN